MRVDVFCESGGEYGLGHFYRALKLIALLKSLPIACSFTLHNRGESSKALESAILALDSSIIYKHYEWLSHKHIDLELTIVDSYEAKEWFYHSLSQQSLALICLDDTLRDVYPPHCYILSPFAKPKDFTNAPYHLWCGEAYIITPPLDSAKSAESSTAFTLPNDKTHIFINFGGADTSNLTQALIDIIAQDTRFEGCHFHIVLGAAYSHQVPQNAPNLSIYHHLAQSDLWQLAKNCQIAISAGSGIMLELLSLRVPSIVLESASNQHLQIKHFAKKGAIIRAKNIANALDTLANLLDSSKALESIKATLASLDIGSALPQALLALVKESTQNTHLSNSLIATPFTEVSDDEAAFIRSMRNHKSISQWMYAGHISQAMHSAFLEALKSDSTRRYFLVSDRGEYIGVGSLMRINLAHKHAFLGIYTNPFSTQHQKGARILAFLEAFAFDTLGLHSLHLEVLGHNARAIRFYENHGFKREGILHEFIANKDSAESSAYYDVVLMQKIAPNKDEMEIQ